MNTLCSVVDEMQVQKYEIIADIACMCMIHILFYGFSFSIFHFSSSFIDKTIQIKAYYKFGLRHMFDKVMRKREKNLVKHVNI